jgi:hypothetical protein
MAPLVGVFCRLRLLLFVGLALTLAVVLAFGFLEELVVLGLVVCGLNL